MPLIPEPQLGYTGRQEDQMSPSDSPTPGEWEAFMIIGEERWSGQVYYMVAWKPTLEPASNLTHLSDLISDWQNRKAEAQALVPRPRSHKIRIQYPKEDSTLKAEKVVKRRPGQSHKNARGPRRGISPSVT